MIHVKENFDYENDEIKKSIIDCTKSAGIREDDYIQHFLRIIDRIKHGAGTKDFNHNRINGKQVNLTVDDIKITIWRYFLNL